jgi:16S rRNA U516 pseudouridylate synthase RsuA-like enzyme
VGLEVLRLVRTSFGPVRLGALAPGASRALTNKERDLVLALTKSGHDR